MSVSAEERTLPLWTSSAEASHAKTYPMLAREQGSERGPDPGFGINSHEWFASYGRGSWWSRTLGLFSQGVLESFSETWPRQGMTRSGVAFVLPTLARHTDESGSSLWPTPTLCGNHNRKGASATSGDGLATATGRWATPTASDSDGGVGHAGQGSPNLRTMAAWATPTSRDWKDGASPSNKAPTNGLLGRQAPRDPTSPEGALNPAWVGQLMGFPGGWTDGLSAPSKSKPIGKPRAPRKASKNEPRS